MGHGRERDGNIQIEISGLVIERPCERRTGVRVTAILCLHVHNENCKRVRKEQRGCACVSEGDKCTSFTPSSIFKFTRMNHVCPEECHGVRDFLVILVEVVDDGRPLMVKHKPEHEEMESPL